VRVAWAAWVQGLLGLAKAALFITIAGILIQQVYFSPSRLAAQRAEVINRFEQERKSRVIALIHRQETVSVFGVPVASNITIEDSEAVLRAIRLTPESQPIDVILHTPGGQVLAAEQIAKALSDRKAKVTVFVPHYAMSGGTIISLAADEIVMDANAVLGPVDPQIGEMPAASIVRMVEIKGPANVSDQMLVLADVAQKARLQVAYFVSEILRKHYSRKKSIEIATILSEGRWTHDLPILVVNAKQLGLPVTTDMPRTVYDLMDLYQGQALRALRAGQAGTERPGPAAAGAGPHAVGRRHTNPLWA
jgi:ClpP class serine protease